MVVKKVHKYKSKTLEIFIGKTYTWGLSTVYIMHYNSLSEQLKISVTTVFQHEVVSCDTEIKFNGRDYLFSCGIHGGLLGGDGNLTETKMMDEI